MQIRFATEKDHEQIAALAKRCPQEGMITFFVTRTPQFNTLHRLLDKDAWHLVACKDDNVVGLLGVLHFHPQVMGKVLKAAYMLDFRIDKEYRSGTLAFKLVKTAIDHLIQSGVDCVIVNFLKDNKRPMVFTSGRGGLPKAHFLGENVFMSMLPIRKMRMNRSFPIRPATHDDIPALVDLYNKYYSSASISPVMSAEKLKSYFTIISGLAPHNFLIAEKNGEIKAVTALWDEHIYKNYQIVKANFKIRMVSLFLQGLSLFAKVPEPIRINEPLKQLSLVLYAHDECPDALENLFRHINNTHRGAGYTLINLHAQHNDPVTGLLKKFTGITLNSEMYMFAQDTTLFEKLENEPSPVIFDLSMTL